jgi:hypothetical protein
MTQQTREFSAWQKARAERMSRIKTLDAYNCSHERTLVHKSHLGTYSKWCMRCGSLQSLLVTPGGDAWMAPGESVDGFTRCDHPGCTNHVLSWFSVRYGHRRPECIVHQDATDKTTPAQELRDATVAYSNDGEPMTAADMERILAKQEPNQ